MVADVKHSYEVEEVVVVVEFVVVGVLSDVVDDGEAHLVDRGDVEVVVDHIGVVGIVVARHLDHSKIVYVPFFLAKGVVGLECYEMLVVVAIVVDVVVVLIDVVDVVQDDVLEFVVVDNLVSDIGFDLEIDSLEGFETANGQN